MSCFANALNYIPHKRINYKTLLSVTMFVIPALTKEIGLFVHVIQKGFSLYPCDVVSGCIHFISATVTIVFEINRKPGSSAASTRLPLMIK